MKRNFQAYIASKRGQFVEVILCIIVLLFQGCSKPLVTAKVSENILYISGTVGVDKKEAFNAVRWALKKRGYPIAFENEADGTLKTAWLAAKSDSHAFVLFGRYDLGVNGAYYQLDVHIESAEGKSKISIGSIVKSVISNLKSTGIEERRILSDAKDYLRISEPEITNIGLEE